VYSSGMAENWPYPHKTPTSPNCIISYLAEREASYKERIKRQKAPQGRKQGVLSKASDWLWEFHPHTKKKEEVGCATAFLSNCIHICHPAYRKKAHADVSHCFSKEFQRIRAELAVEQAGAAEAARIRAEQDAAAEAVRIQAEQQAAAEAARIKAEEEAAAAEAARIKAEQEAAAEAARIKAQEHYLRTVRVVRDSQEVAAEVVTEDKPTQEINAQAGAGSRPTVPDLQELEDLLQKELISADDFQELKLDLKNFELKSSMEKGQVSGVQVEEEALAT
jgi:hypothetical protein